MPITIFQANNKGQLNLIPLFDVIVDRPHTDPGFVRYEYAYWYMRTSFLTVPLTSQKVNSFGNKFYIGEVAFKNHGFVASVEYMSYQQQQFTASICLPQVFFANTEFRPIEFSLGNSFFANTPRVSEIHWDLKEGVSFQLELVWLKGFITYNDQLSVIQIV